MRNLIKFACVAMLLCSLVGAQTLSQSTDPNTVAPGSSVSCNTGAGTAPQYHVNNGYFRVYDMATEGVTVPITLCSVRFGVEFALAGAAGGGMQPIEARVYVDPSGTTFPAATTSLTLIHTEMFQVADTGAATNVIVTQPFTGGTTPIVVQPTDQIVIELFSPDGTVNMNNFFIGANGAGETAPSYLEAAGCGASPAVTTGALGFPLMHIILDINYTTGGAPVLALTSPVPGQLDIAITNLSPNQEYYTVYSFTLCNPTGSGPWLGLCSNNPIGDFTPQFAVPIGVEPLHFISAGCASSTSFAGLPSTLNLEAVSFPWPNVTSNPGLASNVSFVTIL